MTIHALAGKPAPKELLVDIDKLRKEYYTGKPDITNSAERVSFGTSGHRGSSLRGGFNEAHVLAITQAICEYRNSQNVNGPLYPEKIRMRIVEASPCFGGARGNGVETRSIALTLLRHARDLSCQSFLKPWPNPVWRTVIGIRRLHNPPEDGVSNKPAAWWTGGSRCSHVVSR